MKSNASRSAIVDRDNAVPLYHQIFLWLRDDIVSGKRAFGEALPTEAELSASFEVSRITARRALFELAEHGFVGRRRRVGTRVTFEAPTKPLAGSIDQAVESLIAFGHDTKVKVLEIVKEPANAEVATSLELPIAAPIVRAVRVRELEGQPLGVVVSHVPARLAKLVTRKNLTTHPMLELLRKSGHKIGDASQTITALLADSTLAKLLRVEARAPILRINRVVFDDKGTPLLITSAQYRGDRYHIDLDLRGASKRKHS